MALAGLLSVDTELAEGLYMAMRVLTWGVVVPLAALSLVIGVVQSVVTPWGLFRHYWIIVKLALTIFALAVLLLQTSTIDALAVAARTGNLANFVGGRLSMVLHGSGGLLVLLFATVLSIYKPRGMTAYGVRALAARSAE
ncbi:MAG: hypothetical protein AB7G07_06310 [Bauldia sp.]